MSASDVMDLVPYEERNEEMDSEALVPVIKAGTLAADPYVGVSALAFDEKAQNVLSIHETVPDEWIDIRPEGLIYLSHMKARHILNKAFGYGGWAIVPVGEFAKEEKGNHVLLYRQYRLYVNGRYAGETVAAGDYWTNNPSQNYADAAESCQSYALNRLAKNFGIASQCWDKAYGERWKKQYAETYVKDGKTIWRKKIDKPLDGVSAPRSFQPTNESTLAATTHSRPEAATPPSADTPPSITAASGEATIRIAHISAVKYDKNKVPYLFATDDDGCDWVFKTAADVEIATMCQGTPELVSFTYTSQEFKGKVYRNVRKPVVVEK